MCQVVFLINMICSRYFLVGAVSVHCACFIFFASLIGHKRRMRQRRKDPCERDEDGGTHGTDISALPEKERRVEERIGKEGIFRLRNVSSLEGAITSSSSTSVTVNVLVGTSPDRPGMILPYVVCFQRSRNNPKARYHCNLCDVLLESLTVALKHLKERFHKKRSRVTFPVLPHPRRTHLDDTVHSMIVLLPSSTYFPGCVSSMTSDLIFVYIF